jgi:hypothetical protein
VLVVIVVAFVLVGVVVIVTVVVLIGVAVNVVVLVLAFVVVVVFVLVKDADLLLIPTAARRSGSIAPGGRACSASSSRGARARSLLADPEGVSVSRWVACAERSTTIVSVPLWQMVMFSVVVPVVVVVVPVVPVVLVPVVVPVVPVVVPPQSSTVTV